MDPNDPAVVVPMAPRSDGTQKATAEAFVAALQSEEELKWWIAYYRNREASAAHRRKDRAAARLQ